MIQNLTVGFQLKRGKVKRSGKAPIYLRVTLDGKRFEVSSNRDVKPESWDSSQERVKGRSESSKAINAYLSELESKVYRHFNILSDVDIPMSVDELKHRIKGKKVRGRTILQVFNENNKLVELEKNFKYANSTVNQYKTTLERLKNFIAEAYETDDIELEKIDVNLIRRFDIYLRTKYGIGDNTVMKYLKQLKKVIHFAMELGYLEKDPFLSYKTAYKEVNRGYLTAEELKKIENKKFRIKRLDQVRDVFVFACYTGLSYSDLKTLTSASISKGIDGKNWIIYEREKTGVRASIPLIRPAEEIIEKYKKDQEFVSCNLILPIISNQKLNSYLTEIAELCEIDKHITMHLARHTFSTTITLTNGVPIETVQKMLGHKNLSTTQIYSKVVDTKISEDMDSLEKKIS